MLFYLSPSTSYARDRRTLVVGIYENPPKVFLSGTGKPAGIFVDIIEHIAKSEGWKVRYVPGTWAEGLARLARGEIDLMPDVAYSSEREKLYSFHKVPVLSSWFQVYAPKDSGIRSIVDLDGRKVAVLEGSIQHDAFKGLIESFGFSVILMTFPDYKTLFQKVKEGKADAAVSHRFHAHRYARSFGLEDTAVIFQPTTLFFAAPKRGYDDLLETLDDYLLALKKDPKSIYYQSLKQWVGEEVRFRIPSWVKMAVLGMGLVLFFSVTGSLLLKHQVNVKTQELRRANEEMEQRIENRTAELAEAMKRAQEADRLKSAFLATMSHELRTPLNSIIGFTGILLQGLAGPLNEEQQKQLTMVQTSARHLLALINDILDISKIEAGQLTLSSSTFDLKNSLEKIVNMVAPLAEKKGLRLTLEVSDEVGALKTDQRRFEQVLLNLLNNAVKFTEKGEVKVSCLRDGDGYLVSVRDTGIGMRPEEMEHIFEPFRQIDTGLTRKYEGTGLGLSISKRLVEIMGGSIQVASQFGQGSTFTVRLPKSGGRDEQSAPRHRGQ
ncbi:MAG: ATP-binding protein [Desulfobacterota bacterium]|nr:ATP-binding protein [Thermodesulfobacteriota bacterium]